MTSIVEHFGRRRTEQQVVPAVRPTPIPPHEQTAQALAFVTRLNDEVGELRNENGRLRADLNVAWMRIRDLEQERTLMRAEMLIYQRYSVEVRTHLQHIVDVATRANEAALAAGEIPEKPQPEHAPVEQAAEGA